MSAQSDVVGAGDGFSAAPVAIAVFGLALASVGGWHVWQSSPASTTAEWGWVLFINVGLPLGVAGSVLYARGRTELSDWIIVRWIVGSVAILVLLGTWASFELLLAGELSNVRSNLLLGANLGILFGAVAGVNRSHVRRNAELAERERAQREGVAFLNHLLRHHVLNGVTIINGYTDELREQDVSSEHIDVIERQSERIVTLVENVQTLVRSVSGEAEPKPVDLAAVADSAVSDARETYPEATFDLETEPVTVMANDFVRAVLDNLLSNAIEHHDGEPHVHVTVEVANDTAVLRVEDDGVGVPDEIKASFERPDERTAAAGDGLGLYLVHTLVTSYGGSVRIEDNDPRGAVVVVEFPRV